MIWGIIGTVGTIVTIGALIYAFLKDKQAKELNRKNKELLSEIKRFQEEQRNDTLEIKKGVAKIEKKMIAGLAENTPKDEPLRVKIKKADSLYHQEKYKDAYNLYNEINKKALSSGKDKLFVLSLIGKGISIGIQGNYQRAIGILRNAEEYEEFLDENAKVKLFFNLGNCYKFLKNNDFAIEYYSQALKIDSGIANAYNNRGVVYGDIEEYEMAIKDLDRAIELNPKYATAYNNRGSTYAKIEEYEMAVRDFNEAILLNPKFAMAYYNRGVVYIDTDKHEQGINDLDRAIELDPEFTIAYYHRGLYYYDKGKYKSAIKDLDNAIALDPEYADAYNNRACCYLKTGEYDRAIQDCNNAIKIQSNIPTFYDTRGQAYTGKGEYEKALGDLDKAIKLDPTLAIAYFNKALVCEKINKNKEAIKSYKEFLSFTTYKDKNDIAHAKKKNKRTPRENRLKQPMKKLIKVKE